MDLFDIISKDVWQKLQKGFSKALGVNIETVDLEGNSLSEINLTSFFCQDFLECQQNEKKNCISSLINNISEDKDLNYYECSCGAYIYGVPIELNGEGTLAYVIIGPLMLNVRKEEGYYEKIAETHSINIKDLTGRLLNLKKFTFIGIESAIDLLREVAHYILKLSYDTKKLNEKFNVPFKLDFFVKELYRSNYFEEFLNALLEASINTAKATTGSIMLLDEDKDELSIKLSRGLNEEIVKSSRVKIGEGISGLVARERNPLLIDDTIEDKNIIGRLKRPDVNSSLILPLEVEEKLFGIMNLNSKDEYNKFNRETLDLVSNLTNLTKIALSIFPKKDLF